jgi:hypothetical protein
MTVPPAEKKRLLTQLVCSAANELNGPENRAF